MKKAIFLLSILVAGIVLGTVVIKRGPSSPTNVKRLNSPSITTSPVVSVGSTSFPIDHAATPAPSAAESIQVASPIVNSPKPSSLPNKVLLSVPFTVQAPDGDWSDPWSEGCEEAALIMAHAYYLHDHEARLPVLDAKNAIKSMVDWEVNRFGSHKDLGVDDMAIIAREYYGVTSVKVKHSATLEDIRRELRDGNPVIVPAAGQLLNNPYFKHPGPPYHVFIIKGYEGDNFITNENGTRQGEDYIYSAATLQNALHDQSSVSPTTEPMAYLVLQ